MKTVFKSSEIYHQWAHQLAPRGRAPASISFEGVAFQSYATEIGRILERKGRKAYLLNITSYSPTTSGHQSALRRAVPHDALVFRIGDIGRGCSLAFGFDDKQLGTRLFDHALEAAAHAAAQLPRARSEWKKNSLASEQAAWLADARAISEFFSLRRKVDDKAVARLADRIAADRRVREAAIRKANAEAEARNAEQVAKWVAGEPVRFPIAVSKIYLRVVIATNDISRTELLETSRGVTVPLAEAERAYRFAQRVRATGWRRNGEQFAVGKFQLDSVSEAGIIAGCHHIDWATAEAFAAQQGWLARPTELTDLHRLNQ